MNMQTPAERFEVSEEIIRLELGRLEQMALNMPSNRLNWDFCGNYIHCTDTEVEIGGPVCGYPEKQWIKLTCPAQFLKFIEAYRQLEAENMRLRETRKVA